MNNFREKFILFPAIHLLDIPEGKYAPIDISSNNEALRTIDVSSSEAWDRYIKEHLEEQKADIAYGGYLERRDIYSRSTYFKNNQEEERNIHLGLDLWTKAGTKVLAALDGTIHSFQNNKNHGDYGPTIILKHATQGLVFHTLYGHLSLASIEGVKEGTQIKHGEVIGALGEATVNGDYAPHLHFQIILDMQDYNGDYPGVCSQSMLNFYTNNCPDPNILLKLPI